MVVIENAHIRAEISELGAEIRKLTVNGKDRFWNGNPEFWEGVAPVLFPICGGLKDDTYTVNGKEYKLKQHGFAKNMEFKVEKKNKNSAVFLLTDNEETLKCYPWKFEFRIKYTITGNSLKVDYDVKNNSDTVMYTSVGSHEGFLCEGGIENYDLIFERKETLKTALLDGHMITRETETVLFESDTLPIYNEYFTIDALILTDIKSRFVTLRNRKTGEAVSVNFNGFDYLLVWTKINSEFICIEPWTNFPSYADAGYEIELKEGMTALEPQAHLNKTHIIYF